MAKRTKIEFTDKEFQSFLNCIDSLSAIMEECVDTQKDIKAVDRSLKRAGHKREFN